MHKNKSAAGIYRKEESHTSNDLDFVLRYPWHLDYTTTIQNIVESVISRLTVLHRNDKNTKKDNC